MLLSAVERLNLGGIARASLLSHEKGQERFFVLPSAFTKSTLAKAHFAEAAEYRSANPKGSVHTHLYFMENF